MAAMSDFFIWAHRGASAAAPENTMAAFRAAETSGADGIELDVHLSRDGVPVVIHDETVDRTTDGRGRIAALPLAQLRQFDAGIWFSPAFAGEPVPTLEEVFAWAADRLRLNVEIKAVPAGLAVIELLRAYPQARVLISSFDHTLLESLRLRVPDLPLAFLVDSRFWGRAIRRAAGCRAESVHPRYDLLSRPLMAACRRHGLAVHCWTVDRPDVCNSLRRLGATGIFTNDPALIIRHLRRAEGEIAP
jgi:glycerophosphoryl diester phosphodiesterase